MPDKSDKKQNKPHLFQPGKSGNPKGRPKGTDTLSALLKRLGEEELDGSDMDKREAIMRKVYKLAFDGQPWAVQFIADRTEGKPNQKIDIEQHDPAEVRVIG